jgi:hypothetical protein
MMKDVFFFQTQNDKILILPERPQHAIAFLLLSTHARSTEMLTVLFCKTKTYCNLSLTKLKH